MLPVLLLSFYHLTEVSHPESLVGEERNVVFLVKGEQAGKVLSTGFRKDFSFCLNLNYLKKFKPT